LGSEKVQNYVPGSFPEQLGPKDVIAQAAFAIQLASEAAELLQVMNL
jgi:hypothetical protein